MGDTQNGFVALLDFLGVRNRDVEGARRFLEFRDDLRADLEKVLDVCEFSDLLRAGKPAVRPEVEAFADNIVVTWVPAAGAEPPLLIPFGMLLAVAFRRALGRQMLLRGAVAMGQFVKSGASILGPAVGDAAEWFEEADWAGIVATPRTGNVLAYLREELAASTDPEMADLLRRLPAFWCEYDVPITKSPEIPLWVVGWPAHHPVEPGVPPRSAFRRDMARLPVPKVAYSKIRNIVRFFEWHTEKHQIWQPMKL